VGRVEREALISAPPERVWQALVDQRQVSAWFGADVVLEARTGGRATFRWPDGRERAAVVELLDPRRRLVLRWSPIVRMPGGRTALVGPGRVELLVSEAGGGTLVRVVEESADRSGETVAVGPHGRPNQPSSPAGPTMEARVALSEGLR
jgi:uncharacterized protein YndB with AHSA1/START domain